jgi:2-C-methyl-D-erythritol 2,4-cyclodiphosphate synthase
MRERIAEVVGIDVDRISVKATTTERLGFEGREEGVSATAVTLLIKA